jgi:hypothetical protein
MTVKYNKWMNASAGVCSEWAQSKGHLYFFGVMEHSGDKPIFIQRGDGEVNSYFADRLGEFDFILAVEPPAPLLRVFTVNAVVRKTYEYNVEVVASSKEDAEHYVEQLADNGSLDDMQEEDCNSECDSVFADCDGSGLIDEDEAENYEHRA